MAVAELKGEDRVTEVVPVDNDLGTSEFSRKPHKCEGRDTWRVLAKALQSRRRFEQVARNRPGRG